MSPRNALEIGRQRRYRCPRHADAAYVSVTTALNRTHEWGLPAGYAAKQTAERAFDRADEWLTLDRDQALRFLKAAHTERRDAAADAGTLCHAAAERIVSGVDWREPIPELGYDLPRELWPVAERIEDWWKASGLRVVLIERTVYNHLLQYAGTLDALVTDGTRNYILDLKTQAYPDPAKWRLQLAAYADADEWVDDDDVFADMPTVHAGLVLWIPRDTPDRWQVRELDLGMETRAAFRSVYHAWRFLTNTPSTDGEVIAAALEEVAA